jgi:hypothetical protein
MFNRRFLYAAMASTFAILFHINALAQLEDRTEAIREITALRKELDEEEKQFLSPSVEDQAAFAEFLKQPNTGLIRLFPRGLYKDRLVIRSGGSVYKFSASPLGIPDIELDISQMWPDQGFSPWGESPSGTLFRDRPEMESRVVSSSRLDPNPIPSDQYAPPRTTNYYLKLYSQYGFIVTLGKVPLEKVTLEHKGVKFLAAFDPPSTKADAREVFERNYNGVSKNRYLYKREARVIVNQTYALRSIYYDRSDVLAAFRVVRKEKDGSLVILWKRLKEFPPPPPLR